MRDQAKHLRTAAEAVAQADAKYRIRAARGVRFSGGACLAFGIALLIRRSTWTRFSQAFAFTRSDGSTFSLSLGAVIGFIAIALGLVLVGAGFLLLRRAIARARANPVTASVIGEALSGGTERWFT
jgi:hypothetical protein